MTTLIKVGKICYQIEKNSKILKSNFTSWYDLNIVINNLNMINTKKKYKKKKN